MVIHEQIRCQSTSRAVKQSRMFDITKIKHMCCSQTLVNHSTWNMPTFEAKIAALLQSAPALQSFDYVKVVYDVQNPT